MIDFGLFCGEGPTPVQPGSKIVVLSRHVERACGIIATRVVGLRHAGDFSRCRYGDAPAGHEAALAPEWHGLRFADRDGRDWQVLDIRQLLDAPAFLQGWDAWWGRGCRPLASGGEGRRKRSRYAQTNQKTNGRGLLWVSRR